MSLFSHRSLAEHTSRQVHIHMVSSSSTTVAGGGDRSRPVAPARRPFCPETATGSHVLNVKGYNETLGFLVAGKFVTSSAFTAGGHGWRVMYYPNGRDENYGDYISVYLDRLLDDPGDDDSVVMARFKFSLLVDQASEPWHIKELTVLHLSALKTTHGDSMSSFYGKI